MMYVPAEHILVNIKQSCDCSLLRKLFNSTVSISGPGILVHLRHFGKFRNRIDKRIYVPVIQKSTSDSVLHHIANTRSIERHNSSTCSHGLAHYNTLCFAHRSIDEKIQRMVRIDQVFILQRSKFMEPCRNTSAFENLFYIINRRSLPDKKEMCTGIAGKIFCSSSC